MTTTMETPPQGPEFHHEEIDNSPEAIAERVRALYGMEKTGLDELLELSRTEPESERLEVLIDDLAYEALNDNVEFTTNARLVRGGNLSHDDEKKVVQKQRELLAAYRQAIVQEAGLSTESSLTEIERSKQKIQEILDKTLAEENPKPDQVLEALGIISRDKDGREIFTYPQNLFPKSTDNKWETYLETVKNHVRAERALANGTVHKSAVGEADRARRTAHTGAAQDVHEILGLGKLPDSKWDLEKTRSMLAKMRDTRFPTVETAEKSLTEEAVIEGVIGLHALRALHTRLSDMHKPH